MSSSVECCITVISHGLELDSADAARFENFLNGLEVKILDQRALAENGRAIDYTVKVRDPVFVEEAVKRAGSDGLQNFDVIFQKKVDRRRPKKLFVFDMDSTLIYQEVIELIAAQADIEAQVARITEKAMNGEIDFTESLKERVALLRGIQASTLWDELKQQIRITKGARELCRALRNMGCVMAVCSGGFLPLAEYVKSELGLNYAFANNLGTDSDNKLDGTTRGYVVNGEKKAELLLSIAKDHEIDPRDAVAVGDGANDLLMMASAGYGIAWNAKPKVRECAPCSLNTDSLQDILYILGYDDSEITKMIE